MFWIVHLFALLLFWPALFITVPLHIIAGRMAPQTAPGQRPPPLPSERNPAFVPGWVTLAVVGGAFATVFWLASSPSAPSLGSTPVSPPPAAQPGVGRFRVASDATGIYELISVDGPRTARKIVTLREGPSGKMYTTRIYNCETLKVRQLGAAETIERMHAYKGPSQWAAIVPGSIADGVGGVACKPR